MSSAEENKNNILEVFKEKADELSEIASSMPEKYKHDARKYFFQHCDSLKALLDIKQEYEASYIASRLQTDTVLSKNTSQTLLEENDGKISNEKQKSTLVTNVQKDVVSLDVDMVRGKVLSKNRVKSDHVSSDGVKETIKAANDLNRDNDDTVVNIESNIKKIPAYSDSHLEIFYESTQRELKERKGNCTDDDETDTWPEAFDEGVDERTDNAATNGEKEKLLEDRGLDKKTREPGQDIACDISELIKCIPQLSQYMEIDPKNVTVLKDDDEEDDKCLHISVELSDGTVQKFKVAGYIPSMTEQAPDSASAKDDETKISNMEQESKEQAGEMADVRKGPSILGSRLRARKQKAAVTRRGPGRPKNENIPAPEISEKGETFYRCEECKATVKTYNALIVHMRTHTGSRPFQCSFCNKSFTTKGNMRAHEMTTHSDSKPWKCEYCDKRFKEKKVMKIHERIHTGEKPYSCSICEKAFTQRSVMLEHMLTHSNNRPHLCDHCGQGFRGLSSLKAHKKRHIGLREFQCDSCEKAFVCKNELKRHLLTHTGDKPYSCEICSKAFTRLSYLKEHVNLHTGAKPFTCAECGLAFSDTMSLHRHKKKHKVENEDKLLDNENEPATLMNTICDNVATADVEQSLTLEIPEHMTIDGEQTSIQVVVDENTSMEDFQKLHSLLLSATGSTELMMNSQDTSKHLYQVLCVNPDTQEVVGKVEGQEVIVESQSEDTMSINLQYNVH
ncbi:zinc finger protein 235-like [Mercenaria mercenaria]|uniref:zinc finger protein 235-like n=1 Tax=Mercenaria mercenaria TaxID=6596 RepID=UPI00234F1C67|nr:zinc finger protein 235-like [Mercenaria mercenaria]